MILTSAIGKFTFDDKTVLSHAKLVRDTVVGQMLNPKQDCRRVKDDVDACELILDFGGVLAQVPFELELR